GRCPKRDRDCPSTPVHFPPCATPSPSHNPDIVQSAPGRGWLSRPSTSRSGASTRQRLLSLSLLRALRLSSAERKAGERWSTVANASVAYPHHGICLP